MSERLIFQSSLALIYGILGAWIVLTQPLPFQMQLYVAGSSMVMVYGFFVAFKTPPQYGRTRRVKTKGKRSDPPPTPGAREAKA